MKHLRKAVLVLAATFSLLLASDDPRREEDRPPHNGRFATADDIANVKEIRCCELITPDWQVVRHVVFGTPIPRGNDASLVWEPKLFPQLNLWQLATLAKEGKIDLWILFDRFFKQKED